MPFRPQPLSYDPNQEAMFASLLAQGQQAPISGWGDAIGNLARTLSGTIGMRRQGRAKKQEMEAMARAEEEKLATQNAQLASLLGGFGIDTDAGGAGALAGNPALLKEALTRSRPADPAKQEAPKMVKAADGYQYWATGPNAGQRVLPGVEAPKPEEKEKDRRIVKGADGYSYYADTGERVLPGVAAPEPRARALTRPVNMVNQRGDIRTASDSDEVKMYAAQGYSVAGDADITKSTQGKIEEKLLQTSNLSKRLDQIEGDLDPKFLNAPFQAQMWAAAKLERTGAALPEPVRRNLEQYSGFKQKVIENLNLYIKEITGAQMSEAEAARIQSGVPNLDDSPTQFQSKFDSVVKRLREANKRYRKTLGEGTKALAVGEYGDLSGMSDEELLRALQ